MDKTSQTISSLRQEVENLKLQLLEYKQGKRIVSDDGVECINDMYHENTMLQTENNSLKTRVKALQETVDHLIAKNSALLAEKDANKWISADGDSGDITEVIKDYIKEIELLRARLLETEEINLCLRSRYIHRVTGRQSSSPVSTVAITGQYDIRTESPATVKELIQEAKQNVRKLKRKEKKMKSTSSPEKESGDNTGTDEDKDVDEKNEDEVFNVIMPESSSSESEDQEDYTVNLADLTCEISLKEKLIRQVEMQQRRMAHMQVCYEEKIHMLQKTILATEHEREVHLREMDDNTGTQQQTEKARRVNEDFERKINALKKDVQNMQVAKKQHVQMMKNESRFSSELNKLKSDLADMKKAKVALLNKMKEEAKKHKETECKRNKEITQLKKDQRNKDTRIKTLETEKNMKEVVLRRKQEELMALRKRNKDNKSGNLRPNYANSSRHIFTPKIAKQKWQNLEKKIMKLVLNKQSIAVIEKDMNFYLVERERICRLLEAVERKLNRAKRELKEDEFIRTLEEEKMNLMVNLDYAHEQINECQTCITQIDTTKSDIDTIDLPNLFKNLNIEELKYLIEKLSIMSINQSFQVVQQESIVQELELELKRVVESNSVQEQLLMHMIHQANEGITSLIESRNHDEEEDSGSDESVNSSVDSSSGFRKQDTFVIDQPRKKKAREMAATAEDILFSGGQEPTRDSRNSNLPLGGDGDYDVFENFLPAKPSEAMIVGKLGERDPPSPSCLLSSYFTNYCDSGSGSYPVTSVSEIPMGEMRPFTLSPSSPPSTYLKCVHVAEGHKDGVMCVASTGDVLFSGSKDRTVKIWDLATGREVRQLIGHPNFVTKVKYCEYTRLTFTTSMATIKVWDLRQNPPCVQTLRSSGVSRRGSSPDDTALKHVIPPGEHQICDIALSQYGSALFSAASGAIRMWDLNMFQSVASLNCGFQSLISSLAVNDIGVYQNRIVSGSHDHSIKVFEVLEGSPGIHSPKYVFTPPHYDAIQALTINGDFLFSASTDMCIKKWNLKKRSIVRSLPSSPKNRLCALNVIPSGNIFLAGFRSGYLSLWSADTFELLEELRAHRPAINAISSNRSSIFTASDDSTIGVWKLTLGKNDSGER